jgi:hypothetical protein
MIQVTSCQIEDDNDIDRNVTLLAVKSESAGDRSILSIERKRSLRG